MRLLGSATGVGKFVNPPLFANVTEPFGFVVNPDPVVVSCTVTAVGITMDLPPMVSMPSMIVPVNCHVPAATFVQLALEKFPEKTIPPPSELETLKVPPGLNVATLPILPMPVALSVPVVSVDVVRATEPRQAPHGVATAVLGTPNCARPLTAYNPEPVKLSFVFRILDVNVPPVSLKVTLSARAGSVASAKHKTAIKNPTCFIIFCCFMICGASRELISI